MQLEHSFTVAAGVEQAWQVLSDLGQIAAHIPGAKVSSAAPDLVVGSLKVKLGPLNLNYKGSVTLSERDDAQHCAVIAADGTDARNGTATAAMTARLAGTTDTTTVTLTTDLELTGKPAQFGATIMEEVGTRLVGQFADNLATALASAVASTEGTAVAEPVPVEVEPTAVEPTAVEPAPDATQAVEPEIEPVAAASTTDQPADERPDEPSSVDAGQTPSSSTAARAVASMSAPTGTVNLSEKARPIIAKRLAPVAVALVFGAIAVRRRRSR